MTTRDLLFFLRDELLKARREKNRERLNELGIVCSVVSKAAYAVQDKSSIVPKVGRVVGQLLEDLECSVNDSFHGVEWKSEIPTDEQITDATDV